MAQSGSHGTMAATHSTLLILLYVRGESIVRPFGRYIRTGNLNR